MALHVNDVGKIQIFDTDGFDMSDNSDVQLVFTKPDGTQVTKTSADGVTVPSVDFNQNICGVDVSIPANTYFQYAYEAGVLDQEGLWQIYGVYIDSTPKNFASIEDSFTVLPRG